MEEQKTEEKKEDCCRKGKNIKKILMEADPLFGV